MENNPTQQTSPSFSPEPLKLELKKSLLPVGGRRRQLSVCPFWMNILNFMGLLGCIQQGNRRGGRGGERGRERERGGEEEKRGRGGEGFF